MVSLVTGGAGFFGEVLVKNLLEEGDEVVCFDLNKPSFSHKRLRVVQGDIRHADAVAAAVKGIHTVYHNVAQVPIAKDANLFHSVNETGTRILLEESLRAQVKRVVYTSSSAVFGVPSHNPVRVADAPHPAEAYGRTKLVGEELCHEYAAKGLPCSIVRPRTVLGHGRLGIFQILFEWVYQGKNIPVLGKGNNLYQFVHADDLAAVCLLAGKAKATGTFHAGAAEFGTMREVLEHLCQHAGTGSKVKSVPMRPAELAMNITAALGVSPLGAYHALMYGRSMYFDMNETQKALGFVPAYSNNRMFTETYDWYVANREAILSGKLAGSKHQSAMKQRILALVPYFI